MVRNTEIMGCENLERIRCKIRELVEKAPRGCHSYVAEKIGVELPHLKLLRDGKRRTVDSAENRKYMNEIYKYYREFIESQIELLTKL